MRPGRLRIDSGAFFLSSRAPGHGSAATAAIRRPITVVGVTLAGVLAALSAVFVLSALVPARRATRIDPLQAGSWGADNHHHLALSSTGEVGVVPLSKKPTVYLETTIVSYLTARPSRDLVTAGHQQVTREWWEDRFKFDLVISELVLREAGGGDPEFAALRLAAVRDIPVLNLDEEAMALARELVNRGPLPSNA